MRGSVWSPEAACSSTGPQAAVEARRGRQASRDRMNALIAFALKHRLLMLGLFVIVMVGGIIAFRQLNIEAYPDPTPPMVDIVTQSPGLSPEEIERYITIPIETQTAAIKTLPPLHTIPL